MTSCIVEADVRDQPSPVRARLVLAFAAVYLLWGSTYLGIRICLETLPTFSAAGVRFLTAGSILYAWSSARGFKGASAVEWRNAAIAGGLMLFVGNGGIVFAETRVSSGLVALLVCGTPMWMTLFDSVQRKAKPSRGMVIGLCAGLAGVAILIGPAGASRVDLIGASTVLLASLAWTTGSMFSRNAKLPDSPLAATAMEMICAGAMLLVTGTSLGELSRFDLGTVSLRSVLALGYLIVAGSLGGFTSYIWLLRNTTPARAASYAYVNPVVAVFLGWAILGEPITGRMIAAAPVIIGALALIQRSR
jgi:drug/metabolite transporter (DMT)-like permease